MAPFFPSKHSPIPERSAHNAFSQRPGYPRKFPAPADHTHMANASHAPKHGGSNDLASIAQGRSLMPGHKATHGTFHRGKLVVLRMRDGSIVIDKFVETRSRYLVFEKLGKVLRKDIDSATIYRGDR
jgi:hypothetical protein